MHGGRREPAERESRRRGPVEFGAESWEGEGGRWRGGHEGLRGIGVRWET